MKRCVGILSGWLFVAAAFSSVGAAAAVVPADIRSMCESANKQFTVGLSQGNPAAIAALYSSDALLLAPGGKEATRRETIGRFWQYTAEDGISGLAMSIDQLAVEGEVVIETGLYAMIRGTVGVVETGKYLIVRKREAGQWRIFRHIWNASTAASSGS